MDTTARRVLGGGDGYKMSYNLKYYWIALRQAIRWANRGIGEPIINFYEYEPNESLNILKFPEISNEWLDFIAACRTGKSHTYDIVEGPMVEDTIFNYVQAFVDGKITRAAFWELAKFNHPTHQISCHTISALDTLTFMGSEEVYGNKK